MATSVHQRLLTSAPINKAASVVTNQHGCDEVLRLNGLIEERNILRDNIKAWSAEMLTCTIKRRKELKPILAAANRRFTDLCIIVKNNPDMKRAARYRSTSEAFMAVAKDTLPPDVFSTIKRRALEAMKL